jgi:cycloeucalenol cycloisomerase
VSEAAVRSRAAGPDAASAAGRWFSANPDKAWAEKWFLLYTPYWVAGMAVLMLSGAGGRWGDLALNAAMLALWLPALLVPAWLAGRRADARPFPRGYWLKLNLWIGIYAAIGSYFGSEYFFDVLGMFYRYPQLDWNLDAVLLGAGEQRVPLIMYWSAHFYFLTYHTGAVILMRRVRTSALGRLPGAWPLTVLAAAYGFAYLETFFMAGGAIAEQFGYHDLERMLRWGSLYYALYFVVSFPLVYRIDEAPGEDWPIRRVAIEALAAGMLLLVLLDFATRWVGTIY